MLFSDCMDDVELEGFGVILVRHVTGDDALEQVFVDASGGDMVDDCLHTPHEVVGVPIVAIMYEKPHTDGQSHTLVGILKIMTSALVDDKN